MLLNYLQIVGTDRIAIYKKYCDEYGHEFKRVGLELERVKTLSELNELYLSYHQRNLVHK